MMSSIVESGERGNNAATGQRRTRKPLFSFWPLPLIALVIEVLLLSLLWPVFSVRGWSFQVVTTVTILNFVAVYLVGELVRQRLRMSLRMLLVAMAFAATCCGLVANRYVAARKQQRIVTQILSVGGHPSYNIGGGWGDWSETPEGWMLPNWLLDWVGQDLFGEVQAVSFGPGGLSLTDAELSGIDFQGLPQLKQIFFYHAPLSDAGVASLANLSNLTGVGFEGSQITDAGLAHLKSLPDLEWVRLAGCQVTNDGLAHLSGLRRLTAIDIRRTQISDAGLEHLAELGELRTLWLQNTAVSDIGLDQLKQQKGLKWVGLTGTRVTPEGIADLQSALPSCTIVP